MSSTARPPPTKFPHPLDSDSYEQPRLTRREQALRRLSSAIREKPNWTTKMDDPTIWRKWIGEAREQELKAPEDDLSRRPVAVLLRDDVAFLREELNEYREFLQRSEADTGKKEGDGAIVPGIDCVWKSDGLIGEHLRKELMDQVATLENVPENKKDWHPGSSKQVLDLVHPSLFPVVYHRTLFNFGDCEAIRPPVKRSKLFRVTDVEEGYDPTTVNGYDWDRDVDRDDGYDNDEDDEDEKEERGWTKSGYSNPGTSARFQWMPSEFEIGDDGSTKIISYVNNLNSRKQVAEFYPVLEKIFQEFVPLFNRVLSDLHQETNELRRVNGEGGASGDEAVDHIYIPLWKDLMEKSWDDSVSDDDNIVYPSNASNYWSHRESHPGGELYEKFRERGAREFALKHGGFYEKDPETFPPELKKDAPGEPTPGLASKVLSMFGKPRLDYTCGGKYKEPKNYFFGGAWIPSDVEDDVEDDEGARTHYGDSRQSNFLELWNLGPLTGEKWQAPPPEPEYQINGKTVKVIVKLANIILTPESPEYKGGSWHVEGMLNERIISTGIYYYAQDNITESTLSFRQVSQPLQVMDARYENARGVWNLGPDGLSTQELGSVITKEHRAIAFPNILQHRVSPFRLVDPTKLGYRKILVFFLCDPTPAGDNIVSSYWVAPQNPPSIAVRDAQLRTGPMGKLPEEIFQKVVEYLPDPISWKEAFEVRNELMKERSVYNKTDQKVAGPGYSLCEH